MVVLWDMHKAAYLCLNVLLGGRFLLVVAAVAVTLWWVCFSCTRLFCLRGFDFGCR